MLLMRPLRKMGEQIVAYFRTTMASNFITAVVDTTPISHSPFQQSKSPVQQSDITWNMLLEHMGNPNMGEAGTNKLLDTTEIIQERKQQRDLLAEAAPSLRVTAAAKGLLAVGVCAALLVTIAFIAMRR